MEISNTPTVAYDAGYTETYGANPDSPERELWKAVLRQAADDLFDSDDQIRRDAANFFLGVDLLDVMGMAGINLDFAPAVRAKAKALAEVPPDTPHPKGKRITYGGETRSLKGWSEATGISIFTIGHRLKHGWSIKRALTTPGRRSPAMRLKNSIMTRQ